LSIGRARHAPFSTNKLCPLVGVVLVSCCCTTLLRSSPQWSAVKYPTSSMKLRFQCSSKAKVSLAIRFMLSPGPLVPSGLSCGRDGPRRRRDDGCRLPNRSPNHRPPSAPRSVRLPAPSASPRRRARVKLRAMKVRNYGTSLVLSKMARAICTSGSTSLSPLARLSLHRLHCCPLVDSNALNP
jgi:hypothetical protein